MLNENNNGENKSVWIIESQQAREITLSYGKALGFNEDDIRANQRGELTVAQKKAILRNSRWAVLLILFIIAYTVWKLLPMLIDPAFLLDAIIFTVLEFGFALFLIGVVLISSQDAKALLALFEKTVEQREGLVRLNERDSGYGKTRTTRYYLSTGIDFELQIPHRTFLILKEYLYCRVYFTPRTKYLASVEVLNSRESQNVAT